MTFLVAIDCPVCRTSFTTERLEEHELTRCPGCGAHMMRAKPASAGVYMTRAEPLGDLPPSEGSG